MILLNQQINSINGFNIPVPFFVDILKDIHLGQIIKGKVLEVLNSNEILALINGQKARVQTNLNLIEGDALFLKVIGTKPSLILRLYGIESERGQDPIANVLRMLNLEHAGLNKKIISSMINNQVAIEKNEIIKINNVLSFIMSENMTQENDNVTQNPMFQLAKSLKVGVNEEKLIDAMVYLQSKNLPVDVKTALIAYGFLNKDSNLDDDLWELFKILNFDEYLSNKTDTQLTQKNNPTTIENALNKAGLSLENVKEFLSPDESIPLPLLKQIAVGIQAKIETFKNFPENNQIANLIKVILGLEGNITQENVKVFLNQLVSLDEFLKNNNITEKTDIQQPKNNSTAVENALNKAGLSLESIKEFLSSDKTIPLQLLKQIAVEINAKLDTFKNFPRNNQIVNLVKMILRLEGNIAKENVKAFLNQLVSLNEFLKSNSITEKTDTQLPPKTNSTAVENTLNKVGLSLESVKEFLSPDNKSIPLPLLKQIAVEIQAKLETLKNFPENSQIANLLKIILSLGGDIGQENVKAFLNQLVSLDEFLKSNDITEKTDIFLQLKTNSTAVENALNKAGLSLESVKEFLSSNKSIPLPLLKQVAVEIQAKVETFKNFPNNNQIANLLRMILSSEGDIGQENVKAFLNQLVSLDEFLKSNDITEKTDTQLPPKTNSTAVENAISKAGLSLESVKEFLSSDKSIPLPLLKQIAVEIQSKLETFKNFPNNNQLANLLRTILSSEGNIVKENVKAFLNQLVSIDDFLKSNDITEKTDIQLPPKNNSVENALNKAGLSLENVKEFLSPDKSIPLPSLKKVAVEIQAKTETFKNFPENKQLTNLLKTILSSKSDIGQENVKAFLNQLVSLDDFLKSNDITEKTDIQLPPKTNSTVVENVLNKSGLSLENIKEFLSADKLLPLPQLKQVATEIQAKAETFKNFPRNNQVVNLVKMMLSLEGNIAKENVKAFLNQLVSLDEFLKSNNITEKTDIQLPPKTNSTAVENALNKAGLSLERVKEFLSSDKSIPLPQLKQVAVEIQSKLETFKNFPGNNQLANSLKTVLNSKGDIGQESVKAFLNQLVSLDKFLNNSDITNQDYSYSGNKPIINKQELLNNIFNKFDLDINLLLSKDIGKTLPPELTKKLAIEINNNIKGFSDITEFDKLQNQVSNILNHSKISSDESKSFTELLKNINSSLTTEEHPLLSFEMRDGGISIEKALHKLGIDYEKSIGDQLTKEKITQDITLKQIALEVINSNKNLAGLENSEKLKLLALRILNNIEFQQLLNSDDSTDIKDWVFQIPIKNGEEKSNVELRISGKNKKQDGVAKVPYNFSLSVELSELGKVNTYGTLYQNMLSLSLYLGNELDILRIKEDFDIIKNRFADIGIVLKNIDVDTIENDSGTVNKKVNFDNFTINKKA